MNIYQCIHCGTFSRNPVECDLCVESVEDDEDEVDVDEVIENMPTDTIKWIRNPDYETPSFTVGLLCGDRVLVAIPLHERSGGGFDYQVIVPTETRFDDVHGEAWSDWSWSEVEFYCVITKPKKESE